MNLLKQDQPFRIVRTATTLADAVCYIQYAMFISVPLIHIVFCSFLGVAAQLQSMALHKHDEDFIFLPAYLIRLVEYQWFASSNPTSQNPT